MKTVGLVIRVLCAGGVIYSGLLAGSQLWGAVIANYQGDYLNGSVGQTRPQVSNDGWDYMWNANGPIGTASNYSSLKATGSSYNYDGGSPLPRAEPAAYVYLGQTGGHPGRGSTQNYGGSGNTIDRYAIAAYTVQSGEQGHVYLANGSISVGSGSSNGVEVRVYVNDTLKFSRLQLGGGSTGYFGGYLGYLNAGDTVYVAMGPNTHDGSDTFSSFQFLLAHPDSTGDRWWDADGAAPVNGGTGTWNTTSSLWAELPSGGSYGTWSANMTAHFTGTAGTVTLGEPITARGLGFYTNGYTIAGTNTLTLTSSGTGSLGAATIYVENASDTATISAPIAGSAGLIKTGAGSIVLSNSGNTYTGTTYILQGTVKLGATNAIPRINDNNVINMRLENAVLDLNGYNEALHRIQVVGGTIQTGTGTLELTYSNSSFTSTAANSTLIAGTVKMTPNFGYFTFEVPDGPKDIDVEVSAKLTGTASGWFYKDQPGTLLLSSSQSDFSITNSVMIRRGRLFLGADAPKGAPGSLGNNSAPIQLGDSGTTTSRGLWTYGPVTVGRDIIVYSAPSYAAYIGGYTAHTSYFTGNITLGQNVELQAASGGTVYFTGQISESGGSYGITKTGTGTVVLQNTNNTYSGPTTVTGGVLSIPSLANAGVASPLGTGSSITLSGATLQYTGATTVSTDRTLTTSGTTIIEVPDANGQLVFTGSISSTGELRKLGLGGLQLMGSGTYGYLNVASGYVKLGAPTTTLSSGIQVGNSRVTGGGDATLDIVGGTVTTAWIQVGDALDNAHWVTATVNQTGGTVRTTSHPAENAGVRLGHWPWVTTYYNLSGGTLIVDNNYYLTCAVDGTGTFKQTGGEAFAARIVVNARTGSGGNGTFILEGGTFNLGAGGIVNDGTGPATVKLGGAGGVLRATADWSSVLPMTLSGTGANAIRIDTNGYNVTLSGVLSGTGGLVKTGNGTLTLSANNTYTGPTAVEAGTLTLVHSTSNNNISGSSAIQLGSGTTLNVTGLAGSLLRLASGQTLQGNGAVQGNLEAPAGSFLGAGMSPGTLTITGNYTQGGTLLVELAGYTQGGTQAVPGQWTTNGYDWVSVGGQAVLDGYVQIALLAGFQPASGDVFNVLTAAGGITDQGLELVWQSGSLLPGQYWTYRIVPGQGNEQILQLQLGVPEPASLLLLVLGAAGLVGLRRLFVRKRNTGC